MICEQGGFGCRVGGELGGAEMTEDRGDGYDSAGFSFFGEEATDEKTVEVIVGKRIDAESIFHPFLCLCEE